MFSWFESKENADSEASTFFNDIGNNVNAFFAGVANPEAEGAEGNPEGASEAGKTIGNWFSEMGNSFTTATTPAEDKEQFNYVKHFGELPETCLAPRPMQYEPQELKDELFEDEWEAFQELKKNPECEGFSDRFLMACLFARKLDIKRTIEMLVHNKEWREKNGYTELPNWEQLDRSLLVDGKFALKCPGARGKNGEGIIYVKMGNMFPGQHEDFTEQCVLYTVWNGTHGGLYEGMDYFRNGIMMVADLENMGWQNVDLSLQSKMSSALLDNFPMRTCKILIIHPPWILNAFLEGLRLVIKKKVMDRVYVLETPEQLLEHIEPDSLTTEYGGNLEYDCSKWFDFIDEMDKVYGSPGNPKRVSVDSL